VPSFLRPAVSHVLQLPDTVRPSDPYTPSKSSAIKSPLNFEADTDPSGTVHCTVPHVPSGRIVQYALMIDAGSTGSRIHVYKFNNCGPSPMYEYETFKNIKGGLSSYKTNPQGAAASLDTLLKEALRVVPPALHKCTPVAVKATAGLRLLGATQSEAILRAVYDRLNTEYPFPIHKGTDGVAIMDGAEEGVFAWVTANYLLGAIGGNGNAPAGSHAVFDLGGASTQIVFEPAFTKSGALEPGEHKYDLDFAGTRHVLYQHSYLGYGLMRARAHVHQLVDFMASIRASEGKTPAQSEIPNPCLARDTRRTVEVEDPRSPDKRNVTMVGADVGSFDACNRIVELVMAKDALCTVKPCSFNGVYQPNLLETFPAGKVLLLSYFYDRLSPLHPPSEYDAGLSVETIAKDAKDVCAGEQAWRARWGNMPGVFEELADRPEHCLDLTFMHALLRLGYEFGPDRAIRIGKQIEGTELGWCLGATLAMVAGELTCRA
jgi:guanosine-diphosphatase